MLKGLSLTVGGLNAVLVIELGQVECKAIVALITVLLLQPYVYFEVKLLCGEVCKI